LSQTILRRIAAGRRAALHHPVQRLQRADHPARAQRQDALGGQLYDYGIYRIRQQIAPIPGITLPLPYGGKPRQIMVDLDPQALLSKGISAADVSNAVNLQNSDAALRHCEARAAGIPGEPQQQPGRGGPRSTTCR